MESYQTINPIVLRMKESEKGTVYQSVVAMGIRARQINDQIKNEIHERMADIITDSNENETTTNTDQLKISREFDTIRKPTFIAMQELLHEHLHFEIPEEEEKPQILSGE